MFKSLKFKGDRKEVLFLPHFFFGSGTPFGDSNFRGAFVRLTSSTTKEEVFQAVVEGITHELKLMASTLENLWPGDIDVVRTTGETIKFSKWLQLKADMLRKKTQTLRVPETPALGAALLAGIAVDTYSSAQEAINSAVKIDTSLNPNPRTYRVYQNKHTIYKKLYHSLVDINYELNHFETESYE